MLRIKYMMSVFLAVLCICLFTLPTLSQNPLSATVNVNFENADINTVATQLEKQTPIDFYFDVAQFNGKSFTINAQQITVKQLLDRLFTNSDYHYTLFKSKYIILTKTDQIYPTAQAYAAKKPKATGNSSKDSAQLASNTGKTYIVGIPGSPNQQKAYTVTGYVRDNKTGEPIVGASVQLGNTSRRVITDDYGYYTIDIPSGDQFLRIESLGMNDRTFNVSVHDNGKLDFELDGRVTTLRSVIVSKESLNNVRNAQMGIQRIDIKTIKQVPVVLGETDVLKVMTSLPGVKTIGEASTGLNVRGGSSDQNLLMFNDATIYNPAHFFGMFSAFNPDVVKDVVLYKSSMPARFGGRLSSVVDISAREGNKKQLSGNAGIGPLTGRVMIEGPIIKDRTSFIAAGRTTYAQWLLNKLPKEYRNSEASFYDINLLLSHKINKNNDLYLTAYTSADKFNLNSDTSYGYKNLNVTAKWKHVFNNKLNVVVSSGWDNYKYEVASVRQPENAYKMNFEIQQANFKTHFTRYINSGHTLDFGFSGILYNLNPGTFQPAHNESVVVYDKLQNERGLESAIYINENWTLSDLTSVEAGLRYSVFNVLGPRSVNSYAKDLPRSEDNLIGTNNYERGKFIKTYGGPEYRLSIRQSLSTRSSIKVSVNSQRQYIHMLSNTAAMTPTDTWKLSDPNIKPQSGVQYSLGYFTNLKSNTIEISVEGYYKQIKNFLDYKSGAVLTMNHHIETDVINTKGRAYGAELQVKKTTGKLNGWVSYTWSRILLQQDDPIGGELINEGKAYPANYDKPHDFTVIANYRFNHRLSMSANTTYSTGRPITLPVGRFYYSNSYRTIYGPRNAHRIPDYFRMDLSLNLEGNHNLEQKFHNSWTLGVYNLTGRKNPFSIYYVSEGGVINGYKLSIFGTAIPFITYNIRF